MSGSGVRRRSKKNTQILGALRDLITGDDKTKKDKKARRKSTGGKRSKNFFMTFNRACKYLVLSRLATSLACERYFICNEFADQKDFTAIKAKRRLTLYKEQKQLELIEKERSALIALGENEETIEENEHSEYVCIADENSSVITFKRVDLMTVPTDLCVDKCDLPSSVHFYSHCHCFIQFVEKYKLPILRRYVLDIGLPIVDIQIARNPDKVLHYVSKYDPFALKFGIHSSEVATQYLIKSGIANNEYFNVNAEWVQHLPILYRKQVAVMHEDYWREIRQESIRSEMSPHKDLNLLRLLRTLLRSSPKKGFWIYGVSGFGKTSTILQVLSNPHYTFMPRSNFPLTNFDGGERDIFWDDGIPELFYSNREMILQLCRGGLTSREIKGGNIGTVVLRGSMFVTSNYDPPKDHAFCNRFHCIDVNQVSDEGYFYQLLYNRAMMLDDYDDISD